MAGGASKGVGTGATCPLRATSGTDLQGFRGAHNDVGIRSDSPLSFQPGVLLIPVFFPRSEIVKESALSEQKQAAFPPV